MSSDSTCQDCGSTLSASTLGGKCPRCTARIGFGYAFQSAAPDPASPRDEGGAEFDGFLLMEEIGRGGMGVVYRAHQQNLNRVVALKMILGGRFAGEEQIQRFRAEAEAAAALRHPNIVPIYEVGEAESQHFFSMEFVEGQDLAATVEDSPLPQEEAADIVETLAEAVHYAHEQGIVHRDLKPSNILLDHRGAPRITDFGLAKRLTDPVSGEAAPQLTLTGQVMGSPSFAAPEQVAGRSKEAGATIDIYALGAVLYYLLTGRPPFLADSLDHTLALVLSSPAPSPRILNPTLARDLETICLKCLEKEPERRYRSAQELADDLGRFRQGNPISARPVSRLEKSRRWAVRNPLLASLFVFSTLVLGVGSIGVISQWQRAEQHAENEKSERDRAEGALTELQVQHAELRIQRNEPAEGIAFLAHVLRKDPMNRVAAERLLSVLSQRSFALPAAPEITQSSAVNHVEWSADGSSLITACEDGTVRVWDAKSAQPLSPIFPHQSAVLTAHFSPNAHQIVTGSEGGLVHIWDAKSGKLIMGPLPHQSAVTIAQFHPEKPLLLTGTKSGTTHLWNLGSGLEVHPGKLEKHGELVTARFTPGGDQILTVGRFDGTARFSEIETGKRKKQAKLRNTRIEAAALSPDGLRLAVATYSKQARVWDLESGKQLFKFDLQGVGNDVAFSPDGQLLATASRARRAAIWDLESGTLIREFPNHQTWVEKVTFSPDGLRLLTSEYRRRANVWDLLTGEAVVEPLLFPADLQALQFDPSGHRVVTAIANGRVQTWDIRPGKAQPMILNSPPWVTSLEFQREGERVVVGSSDGPVTVWNATDGAKAASLGLGTARAALSPDATHTLAGFESGAVEFWNLTNGQVWERSHGGRILHVEISADGTKGLTAGFDGSAQIWNLSTGEHLCAPLKHKARLWHSSFSPDGLRVVTGSDDWNNPQGHNYARVWSAKSGEPLTPPMRHQGGVSYCVFSPDGARVLTSSFDHTAVLWDSQTGEKLATLQHEGVVGRARFDRTGKRIATASYDNSARIWDADTGNPLTSPLRHEAEVYNAEFSPDGSKIVTACSSGTIRIWDADSGNPLSDPLPHNFRVLDAHFSPDGRSVAAGGFQARIWHLPSFSLPVPPALPALAETVARMRFDGVGLAPWYPANDLARHRNELTNSSLATWVDWFFADRSERAVSAHHQMKLPVFRDRIMSAPTVEASLHGVNAEPQSGQAWGELAQRLQNHPSDRDQAFTEYASRRSVQLAPEDGELWLSRYRLLKDSENSEAALSALAEAIQEHPNDLELLETYAKALRSEERYEDAIEQYEKIIAAGGDRLERPYINAVNGCRDCRIALGMTREAQEAWLLAKNIPSRPPGCPPECIDLSPHYNAALDEPWHNRKWKGNDLAKLLEHPPLHSKIAFDLRGVIQLDSPKLRISEAGYPSEVLGIKINRTASQLHFLHCSGWGFAPKDDTKVGSYRVHYANGESIEVPLIKNQNIHEWHIENWLNTDLPSAKLISLGKNEGGARIRLYLFSWENPHPGQEVATIDFLGGKTDTAPFLVALTAN